MQSKKNELNATFETYSVTDEGNIEAAIAKHGVIITHFRGVSMYPMLRQKKDLVVIERVNRPLKINDVPLCRKGPDSLVLHRLIEINNGKYVLLGDNVLYKEHNITDKNILGVLRGFYRGDRYVDCETDKAYKIYVFFCAPLFCLKMGMAQNTAPDIGKNKAHDYPVKKYKKIRSGI